MKLDDLTILVLVRDRQENLSRLVRYYATLPCRKIICDSSLERYKQPVGSFDYHYLGPINFLDKMLYALERVDTEFIIDNPDDDMAIISAIEHCVTFLRANPDYVACDGQYVNYDVTNGKTSIRQPKKFFGCWCWDFKSDDPIVRAHQLLGSGCAKNHAVLRTAVLRENYDMIRVNPQIQGVHFYDIILQAMIAIRGNHKVLPIAYQIRSLNNNRLIERVDLRKELKMDIHPMPGSEYEQVRPLAEKLTQIPYQEAHAKMLAALRTKGKGDKCAADTSDWPPRYQPLSNEADVKAALRYFK